MKSLDEAFCLFPCVTVHAVDSSAAFEEAASSKLLDTLIA